MVVVRRRLIFWLIKAYIKKSGKTIIISFLLGLLIFFGIAFASKYFSHLIPFTQKQTIGVTGAYTQDNLPPTILKKLSQGLTVIAPDGQIKPGLAKSWEISDNGRTYTFYLKPNLRFNNGTPVTSKSINYNFSDVVEERPNNETIVFKLKDAYSPFLVTVSRPIFGPGFVGVGEYSLQKIELNGSFVQSFTIAGNKDKYNIINYLFYPSDEALKTAYLLGEISQIDGLSTAVASQMNLQDFKNTTIAPKTDYTNLITLFYKFTDPTLSDEKVRLALTYALPDIFKEGKRAYLPYPPQSIYYNKEEVDTYKQDIEHAKLLLEPDENASESGQKAPNELTIKTLAQYRSTANTVAASWKKLGIKTKIEEVDSVPLDFQIFLGDFTLPNDPDQYTLWHSDQPNNITRYKNLRIDLLLEQGRKTNDVEQRKKIYQDFQKYLLEDAPASFLYFPNDYSIVRK